MYDDFTQERIAKLRNRKGVSARDMSLSIGQNDSYINRIENKKSLPSMQTFFYICEYLGITPQEFFDEGNPYPERLSALVEKLKRVDEKTLTHIEGIVDEILGQQLASENFLQIALYDVNLKLPVTFSQINIFIHFLNRTHCCHIKRVIIYQKGR